MISEKIKYGKRVNSLLADADVDYIVWGEDFIDSKITIYPKKLRDIPGYDFVKKELVTAALVYFVPTKEKFIQSTVVKLNPNNNTIYLSEGNFNGIWKSLRRSIMLGISIQKQNGNNIHISSPEDVLDLTLLNRSGSDAKIKNCRVVYVQKTISEEEKKAVSKKQSLLDNRKYKYFYSIESKYFHDKDCECIKDIKASLFQASEDVPEGLLTCNKCYRKMSLRKACDPYVKQIPMIDQLLRLAKVKDYHIHKFAFEYGLKFQMVNSGELTVKGSEDTWIIKGFDKGHFSLWHNNYVRTGPKERVITEGFHNQGLDGQTLYYIMTYIHGYTYEKHLEAEEPSKPHTKQSFFARLWRLFKSLFNKNV